MGRICTQYPGKCHFSLQRWEQSEEGIWGEVSDSEQRKTLWSWDCCGYGIAKAPSFPESSLSSHNVAVIMRWDEHSQALFGEFVSNQAQRNAECLSAGGIIPLQHTEQHCSEGEWRQLQGSFDRILPPDNLSGKRSSNICLPPGRDINGFKHKLVCCQICHSGSFIQEVWQAESRKLLCCQAWTPWDPAARQPESKDFESELPLYVFNHLLRDYIPDFFFTLGRHLFSI